MANPGKTYNLPCTYQWYYGMAGSDYLAIQDFIKLGGREFQIYVTAVDINEI